MQTVRTDYTGLMRQINCSLQTFGCMNGFGQRRQWQQRTNGQMLFTGTSALHVPCFFKFTLSWMLSCWFRSPSLSFRWLKRTAALTKSFSSVKLETHYTDSRTALLSTCSHSCSWSVCNNCSDSISLFLSATFLFLLADGNTGFPVGNQFMWPDHGKEFCANAIGTDPNWCRI